MSSSDRLRPGVGNPSGALPWALDEFAPVEVFPVTSFAELSGTSSRRMDGEATESVDPAGSECNRVDTSAIEAEAYARGVADGEVRAQSAANAAAEERIASLMEALDGALESVRLHESYWIANAQENIAALSVGVARHIVQREIVTDAATVHQLVQRAVSLFSPDQRLRIRLHPDDFALCSTVGKDREQEVLFTADQNIQRGGCLVEGRDRIIDGRVDTALERLYRTIAQLQS